MRHNILFKFLPVLLALLLAQVAGTQGADLNPFQEHNEELRGAILMVENNMLFMERNAVSYKFAVNTETRITVGSQMANLEALAARTGQPATVKFRVTREGNVAQEVAVVGGMNFSWMERMMKGMPGMPGMNGMQGKHGMMQEMQDRKGMQGMKEMPETCPLWGGTS